MFLLYLLIKSYYYAMLELGCPFLFAGTDSAVSGQTEWLFRSVHSGDLRADSSCMADHWLSGL